MENERKKKFQDYAPPEQKPSGGYNLNGVYYSRDGQRLDDQPKKSWSQREYERAEREKIHCRAKREQGESEVDAQGNPVKDNSGSQKGHRNCCDCSGRDRFHRTAGICNMGGDICNRYTYQRQKTKSRVTMPGTGNVSAQVPKKQRGGFG